jgi:hypothetical protein
VSERSLAHPARPDSTRDEPGGQLYLYPHPLTLARDHAEAERIRLADTAAYSSMCATWGRLGGLTTYYRFGPSWFRLLALRRLGKIDEADLEAARDC